MHRMAGYTVVIKINMHVIIYWLRYIYIHSSPSLLAVAAVHGEANIATVR